MNIPLIFIAALTCLMAIYMMHRFFKRPGVGMVIFLGIQLLAATIVVFTLFEGVLTIPGIDLVVIIAGVILPFAVVFYDHHRVLKKRRTAGVHIPYIEKKEKSRKIPWKVSLFTEHTELWKKEIHATEVYRSLSIQDAAVSENVKKQLILTQRLINLDNYDKAADRYRFLFSILPDSCALAYNTGFLYCFTERYREAYKVLKKAYDLIKGHKKPKGETDEERAACQQGLPDEIELMIWFNMGYALYHMGKYEHALRYFQKVLDRKPDLTVACKNIARSYLALNMEDKAIEYLEKGRLDLRDNPMRIVLGSIYYRQGDTKKALEVLDEAAKADEMQMEAEKWKGKAAIKEKMYDKAIDCFTDLILEEPENPTHYYHLALALRAIDKKAEALKIYEKGIARDTANSMLLYHAGTLLDEMGLREKAVQYLYQSIKGNEVMEEVLNYLGVLLGQMQRHRESVQVFDKGIGIFSKSYRLYFNRGIVLEMARRQEEAVASFEKAYELERHDPLLYYHYTAALIKTRNYAKAIRICKAGMSNYPDDAELTYGLAKVYAQMGEKETALDLLKKVLRKNPAYLEQIRKDPGFKILSRHPGYKSLMVS